MKNKVQSLLSALTLAVLLAGGCQKFEPAAPVEPVILESNMNLQEFKALYQGQPLEIIDGSIVLEGKVISTDKTGNVYRSLYIDDGTAGLEVKIGKTGLYNDYKLGQTVYVKPMGLCLGAYGGSVQLGAVSVEEKYETSYIDVQSMINRTILKGRHSDPVEPIEISEAYKINSGMLCRLVTLRSAVYQGGNGIDTWAVKADPANGVKADYGQHTFKVDGKEVVVRTSGYASFANEKVGLETGDVCHLTGILTRYRDTYQLVLLNLEGVEKL